MKTCKTCGDVYDNLSREGNLGYYINYTSGTDKVTFDICTSCISAIIKSVAWRFLYKK